MNNAIAYISVRLRQASTWTGIAALAAALATSGGTITPAVLTTALTSFGLLHING